MATTTNLKTRMQFHSAGQATEDVGHAILRYGLVVVLLWVGSLKFTAYEADGIKPLIANSPLMSWTLGVMSLQAVSNLIGITEIIIALLIATRCCWPLVSAFGSFWAVGMFLITLTFVFTTPGVWQEGYGFPFPSPLPGQFLAKDILLLGAAIWSAGEALQAAYRD